MQPTNTRLQLGALKSVALRQVWPHEAHGFTQWLSRDENLALLCDELEISVEN